MLVHLEPILVSSEGQGHRSGLRSHAGYDVMYFGCQILCAKVVGATSSEGFLV